MYFPKRTKIDTDLQKIRHAVCVITIEENLCHFEFIALAEAPRPTP